jgi:hypothetical protein
MELSLVLARGSFSLHSHPDESRDPDVAVSVKFNSVRAGLGPDFRLDDW